MFIQCYFAVKGDTRLPARSAPRRTPVLPPLQAARLLDQVRERARYLHFSLRTEQAYVFWVRAFVRFHGARSHPRDMGAAEVEAFLTWLANERHVAVSTHGQALSALLFLYQKVLGIDLPWMQSIGRPKRLARPLYGTGLRIAEAMQLRVKDVDFERRTLVVQRPPAADKLRHPHVAVRSPLDSLGT